MDSPAASFSSKLLLCLLLCWSHVVQTPGGLNGKVSKSAQTPGGFMGSWSIIHTPGGAVKRAVSLEAK
jgi:hypothetical protein